MQHTGFYITHDSDNEWLINRLLKGELTGIDLRLDQLSGKVFSNTALKYFIDEEIRHDHFEVSTGNNNSLTLSSSGEQKKALLAYIIAGKPAYVIVENVFDSIDKESRQTIQFTLKNLAANTLIIQVFSRHQDLLPFIDIVYCFDKERLTTAFTPAAFEAKMMEKESNGMFKSGIPAPINMYQLPAGPLMKMNNINVQYNGRPILHDICWEINPGEFWQLTGPNGSGKSTLLSMITGNNSKAYGQDLVIFGKRKGTGETVWDIKEKIGYFTPSMTLQFERQDSIEKMIISGFFDSVGLYLKPSGRQVSAAAEWLTLIGMDKDKHLPFRFFPEGQQRMILIARAMVKHPPLLILDEPTSGLDDEMSTLFISLINKISAETGTSVLYVSHRDEPNLLPKKVFNLSVTADGSVGKILQ